MPDNEEMTTRRLVNYIRSTTDIDALLQKSAPPGGEPTLKKHLMSLLRTRDIEPAELFIRADIGKSMGYKILNGKRKAGRDAILRIAFALRLNLDETQRLLMIGEQGALYARTRRDALLMYAIEHAYNLAAAQELLSEAKECDLWRAD